MRLTNDSYVISITSKGGKTERYFRDEAGWLKVSMRGRTLRISSQASTKPRNSAWLLPPMPTFLTRPNSQSVVPARASTRSPKPLGPGLGAAEPST